jgi:hypothetical protein
MRPEGSCWKALSKVHLSLRRVLESGFDVRITFFRFRVMFSFNFCWPAVQLSLYLNPLDLSDSSSLLFLLCKFDQMEVLRAISSHDHGSVPSSPCVELKVILTCDGCPRWIVYWNERNSTLTVRLETLALNEAFSFKSLFDLLCWLTLSTSV